MHLSVPIVTGKKEMDDYRRQDNSYPHKNFLFLSPVAHEKEKNPDLSQPDA